MYKRINGAAASAITLTGEAVSQLKGEIGRWVPIAMKTIGAGAALVGIRDSGRRIAKAVRHNPVATTTTIAVAIGAGVGLWLLNRNRQRRDYDEKLHEQHHTPIEVEPVRVEPAPVRRSRKPSTRARTARKPAPSA